MAIRANATQTATKRHLIYQQHVFCLPKYLKTDIHLLYKLGWEREGVVLRYVFPLVSLPFFTRCCQVLILSSLFCSYISIRHLILCLPGSRCFNIYVSTTLVKIPAVLIDIYHTGKNSGCFNIYHTGKIPAVLIYIYHTGKNSGCFNIYHTGKNSSCFNIYLPHW